MTRNQQAFINPKAQIKKWPVASYSVRKVNQTYYNGPIIKIRRSSDNLLADLYCDNAGFEQALYVISSTTNITTRAGIQQWIAGTTVYLETWYDQSGRQKHLTQSVTSLQPIVHLMRLQGYAQLFFYQHSNVQALLGLTMLDFTFLIHADLNTAGVNYQRMLYIE